MSRLKKSLILMAIGVLVALAILRAFDLWWRHDVALERSEHRATTQALVISAYLHEAYGAAAATVRQLAALGRQIGGAGAPAGAWTPTLNAAIAGLTGIGSFSVMDRTGVIRHSTIPAIVGQSRKERWMYQRLVEDPQAGLVADRPFRGLSDPGIVFISLGQRLTTAAGAFDGLVVATFEPTELRKFLRNFDIGERGLIWVFHPIGDLLVREPSVSNAIGEDYSASPIFRESRRAEAGTMHGPAETGGPQTISAFRTISTPPLVVAVSHDKSEVLAPWWREVWISLGVFSVLGLFCGLGLLVLFRQIDARAAAEQALAHSRGLEALGQLTGGVAHDFNNMLTVILGNAEILEGEKDARSEKPISQIVSAARRAADVTARLLAFARNQPLEPRIIDLNTVMTEIAPILAPLLREGIELKLDLSDRPCLARIDPGRLETALMNLCTNARDAMPYGGKVAVRTGTVEFAAGRTRDGEIEPGRYTVLTVEDTGTGVAPEVMAHLFEPFTTTKDVGKGTGLGLSAVYGFVKQSDGHVAVDTEPGRGTTVRLYFPEATGEVAPAAAADTDEAPAGRGETILLVEDEDVVRELTTRVLADLGYRVLAAADGPAAIEIARRNPRLDLLFTDAMLPNRMTGRQIAEKLRQTRPGLPVIYASGYSVDLARLGGVQAPNQSFIAKPYDRARLARVVRALIDQRANGRRKDNDEPDTADRRRGDGSRHAGAHA